MGQPVDDVHAIFPTSTLRNHPPEKTFSRSDCDGVTGKPGRPPVRQCCIAANFSGSPSGSHTHGLQRSTSQPYFDHQKPAVPTNFPSTQPEHRYIYIYICLLMLPPSWLDNNIYSNNSHETTVPLQLYHSYNVGYICLKLTMERLPGS